MEEDSGRLLQANLFLKNSEPQEILQWAWQEYDGMIAASSSFQTQSVPLLHMISQVVPDMPIYFLDTGFHFPETLLFRDMLVEMFELNVISLFPKMGHEGFRRAYGELHRRDPDQCCFVNKVEPINEVMRHCSAWLSGIRRDQTKERSDTTIVSLNAKGKVKVAPMLNWTQRDVWQYIHDYKLPEHPLLQQGYISIGCAPCTRAVLEGEDPRAGRWSGRQKTECGLHTESS